MSRTVGRIALNRLGQRQNFANHQRRTRQRLAHRGLAALDALGQLDFAFAREQRHGAHLAQIHAHRIVGLVAEVLDQVQVGELFALFELLVELDLGLFQDLDAGGVELGEQIVQLAAAADIPPSAAR